MALLQSKLKREGFQKNQADNSLTSCAIYKRGRAVERCSKLFMTFREVLLIGGENVKTQVQQLNEGVSSQRDSMSKCMCTNNHTFSKPKLKQKNATPLEIPPFFPPRVLFYFQMQEPQGGGERWERGLWRYSHENGLLNGRLEQRLLVDFYLKRLFLISWIIMLVFAPPQRRVSCAV